MSTESPTKGHQIKDHQRKIILATITFVAVTGAVVFAFLSSTVSSNLKNGNPSETDDLCKDVEKGMLDPVMVNFCLMANCTFDASQCTNQCPFGFTRDTTQCPTTCTCASAGLYSGDIDFSSPEVPQMLQDFGHAKPSEVVGVFSGNAVKNAGVGFWTKGRDGLVRIPYTIENVLKRRMTAWNSAVQWYVQNTCIRFYEVSRPERRFENSGLILVMNGNGCSSKLGNQKSISGWKGQRLTLNWRGCNSKRTIIHELSHALGFHHEQVRPDRDEHVYVAKENILKSTLHNFKKLEPSDVYDLGTPYDLNSMLHYNGHSYSSNGKPTIVDINSPERTISGTEGPTNYDKLEIRMMYKCGEFKNDRLTVATPKTDTNAGDILEESESPPKSDGVKMMPWSSWADSGTFHKWQKRWAACQAFDVKRAQCVMESQKKVSTRNNVHLGKWSDWFPCWRRYKGTCLGDQFRFRSLVSGNDMFKSHLSAHAVSRRNCKIQNCRSGRFVAWSTWQEVESCSAQCGGGKKLLRRECRDQDGRKSDNCAPSTVQKEQDCNTKACPNAFNSPMLGSPMEENVLGWADWGSWSSCKGGEMKRFRICNALDNDESCQGHSYEIGSCGKKGRQTEEYSTWGEWGECLVLKVDSCAGSKYRYRSCVNADECDQRGTTEMKACYRCSDGYAKWTPWRNSECSATCLGSMKRTRDCIDQFTKTTASGCEGPNEETVPCNTKPCVDVHSPKSHLFSLNGIKSETSKCEDDSSKWLFGDFNGDKKMEAICAGTEGNLQLMGFDGDENTGSTIWSGKLLDCIGNDVIKYAADINGDKVDDLICKKRDSGLYHIHVTTHGKYSATPEYSVALCGKDETPTFLNLNHDLKKDALCRNHLTGQMNIFINQLS